MTPRQERVHVDCGDPVGLLVDMTTGGPLGYQCPSHGLLRGEEDTMLRLVPTAVVATRQQRLLRVAGALRASAHDLEALGEPDLAAWVRAAAQRLEGLPKTEVTA